MPQDASRGVWCGKCKHKTERKLHDYLKERHDVVYQPKLGAISPTGRDLPYDFKIDDMVDELDGDHHFRQVANWRSWEITHKYDRVKAAHALKLGYSMIRLLQEDVWREKCDWRDYLERAHDLASKSDTPLFIVPKHAREYEIFEKPFQDDKTCFDLIWI